MKVSYLISIVSMMRLELHLAGIPECFFRRPNDLINDAIEIGYNGVQAIPIRGLTGYETGIELYENAWNPVNNILQALLHHEGREGLPSCINDWVVSPSPDNCRLIEYRLSSRRIPSIGHMLRQKLDPLWKPGLLEVHPGLDITPAKLANFCQTSLKTRLVIDTWHLRERPSLLGKNETEWSQTINTLAPYVDVIHVNPGDDAEEMRQFLSDPSASITGRLLYHLLPQLRNAGKDQLIVVAEPRPILKGDGGIIQAKRMLETMKSIVVDS